MKWLTTCCARSLVPLLCVLATGSAVAAQASTDIFLLDASRDGGRLQLGEPVNVTSRAGYDNQPWLLPDGSGVLYVSQRDGQTDVFRYDIAGRSTARVTRTPENEYSPSLAADGRMLVVRWPTDMSTGSLWWFSASGEPREEARGTHPRVGYYAFLDDTSLALFINDSAQTFMRTDMRTGAARRIGEGMNGSGPRAIPGARAVSFLRRHDDGIWWLSRLDADGDRVRPLTPMLEGVTQYTWTPDGTVLAPRGAAIFEWAPGSEWVEVARFTDPALQAISRIAISADGRRIALVAARPE